MASNTRSFSFSQHPNKRFGGESEVAPLTIIQRFWNLINRSFCNLLFICLVCFIVCMRS